MVISKGLKQAYDVQDFMYDALMALRDQLKQHKQDAKVSAPDKETAQALGTLGKVWKDAQEQVRIHRGKPLPGSITWEKKRSVGSKRSAGSGSSMLSMPTPASDATAANDAAGIDENAGNV